MRSFPAWLISIRVLGEKESPFEGMKKKFLRRRAAPLLVLILTSPVESSDSGNSPVNGEKRFLRSAKESIAAHAEPAPASSPDFDFDADESEASSEEDFDYESFHRNHPLPILGATTLTGTDMRTNLAAEQEESLMQRRMLSFAGTNAAYKLHDVPPEGNVVDDDDAINHKIASFAGTSAAMNQFAAENSDPRRSETDLEPQSGSEVMTNERRQLNSPKSANTALMYESLSAISLSRSSRFEGADEKEPRERHGQESLGKDAVFIDEPPKLTHSENDLDRGRHHVGLEARSVRPHQQILLDYKVSVERDEDLMPLRIKYLYADRGRGQTNELDLSRLSLLMDTSFNRTASFYSKALSTRRVRDKIFPTVKVCGNGRIPSADREMGVADADVLIYVSGDSIYCGGAHVHAAVCDYDQFHRPVVANINVCLNNETLGDRSTVELDYDNIITSETARILGASASLFHHYRNPDTNKPYGSSKVSVTCVDSSVESIAMPNIISEVEPGSYEVRTPKLVETLRNHFNCMTMTGARLERRKDSTSCFGAFLDERLFFGEQLTSFQYELPSTGNVRISPLTLALLEDSSWYMANFTFSSETPFGRGSGCPFARAGCIGDVSKEDTSGFHCTKVGKQGCDHAHFYKARCDLLYPSTFGSSVESVADMCPMNVRAPVDCRDEASSSVESKKLGEIFGPSSRCLMTDEDDPLCLKGVCNERDKTFDVHYHDEVFQCRYGGQIVDTMFGVTLICPRIAAVCPQVHCPSNCSGRGVCDHGSDFGSTCICDNPYDETDGCWEVT